MITTAGELKKRLKNIPNETAMYLLFEGKTNPIESVIRADECSIAIIRGKGKPRKTKQFTVTEDGLIGGLNRMGATDAMIGEVLDRSERQIKQRRKKIGLG